MLGLLIPMFAIFTVSCEKDDWSSDDQNFQAEVTFGITNPLEYQAKSDDFDIECIDELPEYARITIDDETYMPELIWHDDGNLYTQVLKLASGNHEVTSFELLAADGETIISATPAEGSEFAIYVEQTVPFTFETSVFDKTEVDVEVLCFNTAHFDDFGFNWFNIGQIEVSEIPFFGDICHQEEAFGVPYLDVFDIEDYPIDVPALFEVRTSVKILPDGEWKDLKTFTNYTPPHTYSDKPVRVEWFTHSNLDLEFKFELYVYNFNGELVNVWDYTFNSDDPLVPETDGVVDFVIGGCWYDGTPPQLPLTW